MKNILLLLIFFNILNCSTNKVSNTHGFRLIEAKYDKILLNRTNKNDLRTLIGPPSSISEFDNVWFYIESEKTNQTLIKLGKKRIVKNNILIVAFNDNGLVKNKDLLNIDNMKEIKVSDEITEKKFNQNNRIYNILSTLRDKINAPTRNRQK